MRCKGKNTFIFYHGSSFFPFLHIILLFYNILHHFKFQFHYHHHHTLGIITSPQSYDVRIQGESNSGQVEVYHNNHWAPVCMEDWSRSFGTVVCRQTSFTAYFNSNPSNTPTSGFHLTGLVCSGAEQNLLGCNMTNVGSVNKTCHNAILTCGSKQPLEREREREG